jgi:hypothetical protein
MLRELETFVDLFMPEMPVQRIWEEIFEHVSQLSEIQPSSEITVPEWKGGEDGETPDVLLEFVVEQLRHPIREVADESRRALLDLFLAKDGRARIAAIINRELGGTEDARQVEALSFLFCALDINEKWVSSFADVLSALVKDTPSATVRFLGERILRGIGIEVPQRERRDLPNIYSLELPPVPMADRSLFERLRPGDMLSDTTDPTELARPFDGALRRLSALSGLQIENLTSRLAALMGVVAPRETWNQAAERKARDSFESANLKIAYRRVRVAVAHRAFARLVQELADANAIEFLPRELEHWLSDVDPLTSRIDPTRRPNWICLPIANEVDRYSDEGWYDRPHETLSDAPLLTPDGRLILAELSYFAKLDVKRPTMVRASMIGAKGYLWSGSETPEDNFLMRFPTWMTGAIYPAVPDTWNRPALACRGGGLFRPVFMALSPEVGLSNNWVPAKHGLFAWNDERGNRMVESIYWQDGNFSQLDRYGRSPIVSYGWAVVMAAEATKQMARVLSRCRQYLVGERAISVRGDWPVSRVAFRERNVTPGALFEHVEVRPELR